MKYRSIEIKKRKALCFIVFSSVNVQLKYTLLSAPFILYAIKVNATINLLLKCMLHYFNILVYKNRSTFFDVFCQKTALTKAVLSTHL